MSALIACGSLGQAVTMIVRSASTVATVVSLESVAFALSASLVQTLVQTGSGVDANALLVSFMIKDCRVRNAKVEGSTPFRSTGKHGEKDDPVLKRAEIGTVKAR
jgi:hypothetical protein